MGYVAVMTADELNYKIYKQLESNPQQSQRELAKTLGISLGKANYCIKALVGKGLVKARNFRNNQNKLAYMYLLTPKGIEEKSKITILYFKQKMNEYDEVKKEISDIKKELKKNEAIKEMQ